MNKPKLGLTSVEAAALLQSGGRTKDPNESQLYLNPEFDMDGLTRAALRRAMGFDFKIKQAPNFFHIYSDDAVHVSARSKILPDEQNEYGHIIGSKAIDRLVAACLKLKAKHDAATMKVGAA
jgi:hypothetical protein